MKLLHLFEDREATFQYEMMALHLKANGFAPVFQVPIEKAIWVDVRLADKVKARIHWKSKSDLWMITVYDNGRSQGTKDSLGFDDVVPKVKKLEIAAKKPVTLKSVLAEAGQLPKAEKAQRKENAPYLFLQALIKFLKQKDASIKPTSSSVPSRVWTRGDGRRYKDTPYIEFYDEADLDKAWKILTSMNHKEVIITGPFGSDKNKGIQIDDRAFIKGAYEHRLYVSHVPGLKRSSVMGIQDVEDDSDELFLSIISDKLEGGIPLNVNVKLGKEKLVGKAKSLEDRMLTIQPKDSSSLPGANLPHGLSKLYTIKKIDGIDTIVNTPKLKESLKESTERQPLLTNLLRDLLNDGYDVFSQLPMHRGLIETVDEKGRVTIKNDNWVGHDWFSLVEDDDHTLGLKYDREKEVWVLHVLPGQKW